MRILLSLLMFFSVAAAAQVPTGPIPTGRLPDGVKPLGYDLAFTVDPAKERFSGVTRIRIEAAKPTAEIYLHGLDLAVSKATVTVGRQKIAATYAEVDPSGVARLTLARAMPAGKGEIEIAYSAAFRTGAEGIFRAKVGDDWYAWTQMEPLDARRAFPGFDEPGFKVPFATTITVPRGARAFANTPELSVRRRGRMEEHRFAASKPLPTYLVALGVGAFDVRETVIAANDVRSRPLAFRVIATKGQAGRMDVTLEETPKILAGLERYFGIEYPYEKLDFIASPIMGGAMENAGLIVYGDTLILMDRNAPFGQLRGFSEVVAHELAHQWFGDLVTPVWWTDIWLNESFASWMGVKIADEWRPGLGIAAEGLAGAYSAMDLDSLGRGRPIRQTITENSQVASAFDGITYLKGSQVVSMIENFVGAEAFQAGVRLHLKRYAFGNASAEQFFASVGEAAKDDRVIPALNSFLTQTGVPLLRVSEGPAGIALAQSRYVPIGVTPPATTQTWQIPYCMARGEGRRCDLLSTASATVPPLIGTAAALVPNAGGNGYFRYSLDKAGWERLIAAAPTLPARDAVALADSLWADFSGNGSTVDFAMVVKAAEALARHPERLAAVYLGGRLSGVGNRLISNEQQPAYRALMARIYGPTMTSLGFDPAPGAHAGDPAERQSLRQSLLPLVAREAADPALQASLAAAGQKVIDGDMTAVDPTFRGLALVSAVQAGGTAAQKALSKALLAADDPLFRSQAASAIGAAATAEQANMALELAFADGMQALETTGLVASVSRSPAGRAIAVSFAETNFERLLASYPGFSKRSIISLFSGFCTEADAVRVESTLTPRLGALGGGELELSQAVAGIRRCAALNTAKRDEIAAVLK